MKTLAAFLLVFAGVPAFAQQDNILKDFTIKLGAPIYLNKFDGQVDRYADRQDAGREATAYYYGGAIHAAKPGDQVAVYCKLYLLTVNLDLIALDTDTEIKFYRDLAETAFKDSVSGTISRAGWGIGSTDLGNATKRTKEGKEIVSSLICYANLRLAPHGLNTAAVETAMGIKLP